MFEDTDVKKLTTQQRRRWSEHKRAQRDKAKVAQQLKAEKSNEKKLKRMKKLRESEEAKRRRVKEACKGL